MHLHWHGGEMWRGGKRGGRGSQSPGATKGKERKKKILQLHHLGKGNILKRRGKSRTGNERLASQLPRTSYMVFLCCFVRGRRVCAGRPDTGTGASSGWETLFAADDPLASWPPECLACIRPQDFLFFCLLESRSGAALVESPILHHLPSKQDGLMNDILVVSCIRR